MTKDAIPQTTTHEPMPDAELAEALGVPVEVLPRIPPGKRATYERLIRLADAANLYTAGLGPRPDGALLDFSKGSGFRNG